MFIAASVKAVGWLRGQRSRNVVAALQDPPCVVSPPHCEPVETAERERESKRKIITSLNLFSMSDTFKTIQTYSKHRYFTASQALYKKKGIRSGVAGKGHLFVVCPWSV